MRASLSDQQFWFAQEFVRHERFAKSTGRIPVGILRCTNEVSIELSEGIARAPDSALGPLSFFWGLRDAHKSTVMAATCFLICCLLSSERKMGNALNFTCSLGTKSIASDADALCGLGQLAMLMVC